MTDDRFHGEVGLGLDSGDLADPAAMTLLIAELGADVGASDLDGQLWTGHPLAEAQDVAIVVLDGLVRGIRIAGEKRARARYLVGGDAGAGARAAHHDRAIDVAPHHGFGGRSRIVRIVDWRRSGVGAQVDERHVWLNRESSEQQCLELETGVIRSDGDTHKWLSLRMMKNASGRAGTRGRQQRFSSPCYVRSSPAAFEKLARSAWSVPAGTPAPSRCAPRFRTSRARWAMCSGVKFRCL